MQSCSSVVNRNNKSSRVPNCNGPFAPFITMTASNTKHIQKMLDFAKQIDQAGIKVHPTGEPFVSSPTDSPQDYMSSFIHHLDLVSVDEDTPTHHTRPRVVLSYTVRPEHCNPTGNMHGGAVATLFDFATSMAQAAAPQSLATVDRNIGEDPVAASWRGLGVSRTLAVTYVRPTPCDTDVLIDCEMVHGGRMLSSLRGIMRRRSDGAVLATCEHGKVQTSLPRSSL